jgi:formylglycine-generating enzyme required for sulfatase activity
VPATAIKELNSSLAGVYSPTAKHCRGKTGMGFSLPINEFFWPVAASVAAAFFIYVFKHMEGRSPSEGPQHKVNLAKPFAVGRYAVTFDEWEDFWHNQWSDYGWGKGRRPVVGVNWDTAMRYVAWLRRRSGGKNYRLLSEAEWEYVCRAGSTGPYWCGPSISAAQANYGAQMTEPVNSNKFSPNPWGLYQTHGNVWEWVEDCWHGSYDGAPPLDGTAWTTGCDTDEHVYRGGSWREGPYSLRSAARWGGVIGINKVGLRVARTLTSV